MKKLKKFISNCRNFVPPKILTIILLIIMSLLVSFFTFNLDNDFWFLINLGERILNEGFITTDIFTIHSNLSFFPQQWLTDVIFYLIYSKFKVFGIYVLVMNINLIITFLIYKISMLISNNKVKLSLSVTIITIIMLSIAFITTRPQIFDILLFLMEIYLLELYIKRNNKLYLIGLPIISILLINLHSSIWIMLFVILIPYYFDCLDKTKYFEKDKYGLIHLIIVTIIMFLLGFINPYKIDAIKYLFTSYGIPEINSFIREMQPAMITQMSGIYIFGYIFIVLVSYYYKRKIKLRYLLLFLGTSYLALSHVRGLLYLLVCGIPSLNYSFNDIKEEIQEKYYHFKINNIIIASFGLIFLISYGYFLINNRDILEKNSKHYLGDIANYLDENATKDIKLYTKYEDGAYLEYRGYKCYIDPRAEVFLKVNNKQEDIYLEYFALQMGNYNYKEFLKKYEFDYLIVNHDDLLYNYIEDSDGYEIVYEENLNIGTYNKQDLSQYRIYKRVGN